MDLVVINGSKIKYVQNQAHAVAILCDLCGNDLGEGSGLRKQSKKRPLIHKILKAVKFILDFHFNGYTS